MSNKINNLKFSIAVDGSAASGKSTGSKIIAKHFNFKLLNSGRLYRFLAFNMLKDKKTLKNWNYLQKISKNISIAKLNKKQLNQQNVSYLSSKIAKNKNVRKLLKNFQKKFTKNKKFIIDGRDIGSVIIPNFSVADDSGSSVITADLSSPQGNLSLGSTTGITFTAGSNNSTSMTLQGTKDAINTALRSLSFQAGGPGLATITYTFNDGGATGTGGPRTATGSFDVSIFPTPVIAPPPPPPPVTTTPTVTPPATTSPGDGGDGSGLNTVVGGGAGGVQPPQ